MSESLIREVARLAARRALELTELEEEPHWLTESLGVMPSSSLLCAAVLGKLVAMLLLLLPRTLKLIQKLCGGRGGPLCFAID